MKPGSFVIGGDGVVKPNMEDEAMAKREKHLKSPAFGSPFVKGDQGGLGGSEAGDLKETVKEVKDAKTKSNNTIKD